MSVYKRGKYWIVQFNHNKKTYTRSSKSTRKRDALELERQMRQQLVDTQVLGVCATRDPGLFAAVPFQNEIHFILNGSFRTAAPAHGAMPTQA